MARRTFDLEEARALLPGIRSILGRALQLHAHLRGHLDRLAEAGYEVGFAELRGSVELEDAEALDLETLARARALYELLRASVTEIEATGAEVKALIQGLVDFRTYREGVEEVYLCWKLGEEDIAHWHELDAGFAGRKPIDDNQFSSRQLVEHRPGPSADQSGSYPSVSSGQ